MRARRKARPFDPARVPDYLLGPGRTMPVGMEAVNALVAYLDQHEAVYYGDPIPGRIDALALYVHTPGRTWEEFAAQHTRPDYWKESR